MSSAVRFENDRVLLWPVFIVIVSLLVWRIWTFTILPLLRPDEPKYIPYWIPSEETLKL